jgi:tetratricopeptide (TPR) repeat protein
MAKRRQPSPNPKPTWGNRPAPVVDTLTPQLQAARGFWNEGRRADALTLFAQAMREEPNNVRAYVMAARAHAEKFDFDRMEEILAQLIRRAPNHPGVHHYIGETYGLLKLPHRATTSYEQAAALPGAGPPTWMELASLYERAHRLDEAQELIERTVRSGYDLPLVWLVRGRIQRRQNRLEQAEASFRDLIARAAGSEWACQAWGEIALMKDKAGDFAGATQSIERCKGTQKLHAQPHERAAEKTESAIRQLIDAISREDFHRWREEGGQLELRRSALLTGFPRSGTTLLEQVLDAHTDLISSEERDFIGSELMHSLTSNRGKVTLWQALNELRTDEIVRERGRYFRAMEYLGGEPVGQRVHLDKNPAYNLTIPIVLRFFPETRLVIALRDPRDVVLSCYLRYLPLNAVSARFLSIEQTAQRYALDMSTWLKLRELIDVPWCEIRYEDTVANLETQVRKALDTLGLAWDNRVLGYRERLLTTKQVTSPTYEAVAKPIYTGAVGRWQNYERLLQPALEILEPFVREFGYTA